MFTWEIKNFDRQALKNTLTFPISNLYGGSSALYEGPVVTVVNPLDNIEYTVKFQIEFYKEYEHALFKFGITPDNNRFSLYLELNGQKCSSNSMLL